MKQLFVLVLLAALTSMAFGATTPAKTATQSQHAQSLVPIRSPAALQRYLRETPPGKSPLELLPRGAKKRFLGSLHFGRRGLGSFAYGDLQADLTDSQIHQVLGLFGPDVVAFANAMHLHGRTTALPVAARTAPESALELKFDQFYLATANVAPSHMQTIVLSRYNKLFSDLQQAGTLRKLDDHDLGLLYRAALLAAFWSKTDRYLNDLTSDFDELQQRGRATDLQIAKYHQRLVGARRFKAANTLATAHPSLDIKVLPPVRRVGRLPRGQPSMLWVDKDGQHLWHQAVNMDVPLRIVVVASCHFSEDAARAIDDNPILRHLFHQYAIWLADDNQSIAATRDWNREFPDQPIHIAWQNSQWPMLDNWAMPTFYVFRHGKLIEEWSGWPGDGTALATVRTELQKAGVLSQGSKGS